MSEESFDRVLRQALHRTHDADPCPDPGEIAALHEGTLSAEERLDVERHASSCARCSAQLAILARVAELDHSRRSPSRLLAWHWRWLVPLATAVVVFAVWSETGRRLPVPVGQRVEAPVADQPAVPAPSTEAREYDQLTAADGDHKQKESAAENERRSAFAARSTTKTVKRQAPASAGASSPPPMLQRREVGQAGTNAPAAAPVAKDPAPAPATPEKFDVRVLEDSAEEPKASAETTAEIAERVRVKDENRTTSARDDALNKSGDLTARSRLAPLLTIRTDDKVVLRLLAGRIERSSDGGLTWQTEYSGSTAGLSVATCRSIESCWVAGEEGRILHRDTRGRWIEGTVPGRPAIVRIDAEDALQVTVTARDGRRFSSVDGGRSWTPRE